MSVSVSHRLGSSSGQAGHENEWFPVQLFGGSSGELQLRHVSAVTTPHAPDDSDHTATAPPRRCQVRRAGREDRSIHSRYSVLAGVRVP